MLFLHSIYGNISYTVTCIVVSFLYNGPFSGIYKKIITDKSLGIGCYLSEDNGREWLIVHTHINNLRIIDCECDNWNQNKITYKRPPEQ